MPDNHVLAEMKIRNVLERWPHTTRVFYHYKMACVGCALAPFYSLAEAADIYHLVLDDLLSALQAVIAEDTSPHVNFTPTP
ncbi:MAG: DUF1858 domain-containing protein [Anaerolineae bacterium]|nr:DUF1858 domain-containing protein [Anaerolineae bacterium]